MPYKDKQKQKEAQARAYQRRQQYYYNKQYDRKTEIRDWFANFKSTLKCSLCPENHPACLDFHHREASSKIIGLGQMVWHGFSKKKILLEIEKCDVLCANCHRKLHFDNEAINKELTAKQDKNSTT